DTARGIQNVTSRCVEITRLVLRAYRFACSPIGDTRSGPTIVKIYTGRSSKTSKALLLLALSRLGEDFPDAQLRLYFWN
ncbi:MAG: hypothetical protein WAN11_16340, partial [Syntrophobacteraceae bacterium]